MDKVDLKKELKCLYQASAKAVVQVDAPNFQFLMIDGKGDPNSSPEFAEAVEALFAVSYAAKFRQKKSAEALDYAVMPLEGLWWAEEMSAFSRGDKSQWLWTLMIMQPDFVAPETIDAAITEVKQKKGLPALDKLRLEHFAEGLSAQVLHIGPFSEEGATIERLHQFIEANGYKRRGKHHEIYLSDTRRAAPEKWKTIIRQPMQNRGD